MSTQIGKNRLKAGRAPSEAFQKMTYKELEDEVSRNHTEMLTAGRDRKRELIRRDHELMTEMDSRWETCKDWWK